MGTKGLRQKVDCLKNIFPVHHQVDFIVIEEVQNSFRWANDGVVFNLADSEFRLLGLIYLKNMRHILVYNIQNNALYINYII